MLALLEPFRRFLEFAVVYRLNTKGLGEQNTRQAVIAALRLIDTAYRSPELVHTQCGCECRPYRTVSIGRGVQVRSAASLA